MSATTLCNSVSVPLLDVLPQSAAPEARHELSVRVSLPPASIPAIFALRDRCGTSIGEVGLAAWMLVLDRIRGDARVCVQVPTWRVGHVDQHVPADLPVLQWIAAVAAASRGDAAADVARVESTWLQDSTALSATSADSGLCVGVEPDASAVFARWDSPPLDEAAVRIVLASLVHVLDRMARDADASIASISALPPADLDKLHAWNEIPWGYHGPLTVDECFDLAAARSPGRIALAWAGGQMSYGQLDSASARVAVGLIDAGVAPGDVVGVALDRTAHSIVAILGILRAGAAYLPIDLEFPPERIRFMLDDAMVRLVVSQPNKADRLPAQTVCLRIGDLLDGGRSLAAHEFPRIDPGARAYVMYTSGSTGTPKGVEIAHRSVVRLVCSAPFMTLDADVAMLHAAPLGFDASTLEIWGPLLNGGRCVLHPEAVPTGTGLAQTIGAHGVTSAWLTSALFNAVVDDDPRHLEGLHELLIGGEALSIDHVKRFMDAVPATALINGYGPTECTTFTTTHRIDRHALEDARSVPIGRPIAATHLYVLNRRGDALPVGLVGELYVGGLGVALGYLRRPELTQERFVADPSGAPGARLYRTGDLVRFLDDGVVEFIGRADGQVKIRGFRIETGEIENVLATHADVRACAVVARRDADRGAELVAYVVPETEAWEPTSLRDHLLSRLPEFMVPVHFVRMDALPVTPNGKLDRRALPDPRRERPEHLTQAFVEPRPGVEHSIADTFARILGIDRVGALDNFFDLGGNSLLVIRAHAALRDAGFVDLTVTTIFADPTVRGIACALSEPGRPEPSARRQGMATGALDAEPIAIIGMAGRFPGAPDIESFWRMLDEGRDAIRFFRPDELDASIPDELRADPDYVSARGVLDGVDLFDAGFFGINPKEAELMDPQQRVFLELCWECLERAGHVPDKTPTPIGIFAGMYNATYYQHHVLGHPDKVERVGPFQVMLANEKDYIATRTAHKLNLTGPAISVHTACSTSLVAIAQAFEALRSRQCGMALAGGSSITCPPASGYLYQDGAMLSRDGHTRTFDADAQGTVFSDGAAVVLLKRLSDAVADGNTIHALIRGVAVNNDGAHKASFTAPSVEGQSTVVANALDRAGIDARSISYVEAHGTATPLGDPVEVAALTQAYRRDTADRGFCAIGSVKSNTGHMVIAAGAAGLIKTALALRHERLPGTVHFKTPNPKIDFAGSPFFVQSEASPWPRTATPRRAGVSAFGVGGTNAHVVLEEAPPVTKGAAIQATHLLRLSARTRHALQVLVGNLSAHLRSHADLDLADVAHTLKVGRRDFAERAFVVASSVERAVVELSDPERLQARTRTVPAAEAAAVLLFSGQGSQYVGMGRELHAASAEFRAAFDECIDALRGRVDFDLTELVFRGDAAELAQTAVTQPAIFCIEYALARTWMASGLEPVALVGHSIGEFVAAVLAGVMPLASAVRLVARRGALMQALPAGAMLSVRAPAAQVESMLPKGIQLAADNGPAACVVAGPAQEIDAFEAELTDRGLVVRRLQTSHAFHSAMMEPALRDFGQAVREVTLAAPTRRIVSTVTGRWLTDAEATDPNYWVEQLRAPVRFAPAIRTVLSDLVAPAFVEVGPRNTLTTLVRQQRGPQGMPLAVASLADAPQGELGAVADAAGHLWAAGVDIGSPLEDRSSRRRVELPTYPFERRRHWVDAVPRASTALPTPHVEPAAAPAPASMPPAPVPSLASVETTMTATLSADRTDRRPSLVQRLRDVFEDVSGFELADADPAAAFVELGLDSLTLTQIALQLKKEFAVNVTFRQLMETYCSFDALASLLDEKLPQAVAGPAAPVPAAVAVAVSVPAMQSAPMAPMAAAMPAGAGASFVQHVIQQQMQLMAQQLSMLQGQPAPAAVPSIAISVPAAVPAPGTAASSTAAAAAQPAASASPQDEEAALVHAKYDVKKAFGAIARIHTSGTDITDRQRVRLDMFMRRYVDKTRRSKAYTVEHRPHLADPRVVNGFRPQLKEIIYQIVIERSKGARMWDLDGNEYVDALNGFGMSLFGWQPDFVVDAVRAQLDSGYDIGPQHPLAGEVARLVCKLTGFDRAGLCNTGSEAVMGCVRIARTVTGRSKIAIFNGAYHGIFDEVIVRGTKKLKAVPAAPGILPNTAENVVVLDYGTPETLQWLKEHAEELAAVLVEPVQSRRPDFQPREFLRELRTLTERSGALLIFDEVVTGFRCHPGGIQALFGVRADLASYGKVVGGGFPIGVIAGKREFMDALDGGHWEYGDNSFPTVGVTYFAGTFVRHPLALVAAKAVLEHLEREGPELQAALTRSTAAMVDELNAFCRETGAPIVLKSFSSVWKVFFNEDHPLQDLLFAMMRNRGVHILDNFPCFMTTAHTAQDIAVIKTAFKEAVAELQQSDFLPGRVSSARADFDASRPPVPGARLGRDAEGKPAWFVANPDLPGKYIKVEAQ
jgi:amino acid adenylation domain-containing protein